MTRVRYGSDLEWALSIVPSNASLASYKRARVKVRTVHGKYKFKNKLEVIFKRDGKHFKTYIGR